MTKSYPKFVTLRSLWKIFEKEKKILKFIRILKDKRKDKRNIKKKDRSPDYLWDTYSFRQFVNNFSALLLCKIHVFNDWQRLVCGRRPVPGDHPSQVIWR